MERHLAVAFGFYNNGLCHRDDSTGILSAPSILNPSLSIHDEKVLCRSLRNWKVKAYLQMPRMLLYPLFLRQQLRHIPLRPKDLAT